MKKIILLLAVTISLGLTSCQSDDDTGSLNAQDPIIGTWRITQEFENGVELALQACNSVDFINITVDGKFSDTYHIEENGNCILDETFTGTWENLGNDIYKVTSDDEGAVGVEGKITFSGNTMTVVINDEDGELRQILTRI